MVSHDASQENTEPQTTSDLDPLARFSIRVLSGTGWSVTAVTVYNPKVFVDFQHESGETSQVDFTHQEAQSPTLFQRILLRELGVVCTIPRKAQKGDSATVKSWVEVVHDLYRRDVAQRPKDTSSSMMALFIDELNSYPPQWITAENKAEAVRWIVKDEEEALHSDAGSYDAAKGGIYTWDGKVLLSLDIFRKRWSLKGVSRFSDTDAGPFLNQLGWKRERWVSKYQGKQSPLRVWIAPETFYPNERAPKLEDGEYLND